MRRSLSIQAYAGTGVLDPPDRRGRSRGKRGKKGRPRAGERKGGWSGEFGEGGGDDEGDGFGGRGDGWDDDDGGLPRGTRELGFGLVLVSITTLFLIFFAAYVMLRSTAPIWPPPGTPQLPGGLWFSTAVLAASSATMSRAVRSLRRSDTKGLKRSLFLTAGLGALFLLLQTLFSGALFSEGLSFSSSAYGAVFFSLTGLHAIHIVGGLAYLVLVLRRVERLPARKGRSPVEFCAFYWHYMGAIWLLLFGVLYFQA